MSTKPFRAPSMASFFDNIRSGRLRALFRRGELALVILAILVGAAAGVLVALIGALSTALHVLVFGVERLSSSDLTGWIVLAGPVLGGVVLGLILFILSRTRKKPMVDPIEANALHRVRLGIDRYPVSRGDEVAAQVIDAMQMIRVMVRVKHRVDRLDASRNHLLTKIRTGIDHNRRHAAVRRNLLDQERRASASVLRIGRVADAPVSIDARNAGR